jgi:hypothetical protein
MQDVVLTALKTVQDAEKKITPTKIKYKDLFPSKQTIPFQNTEAKCAKLEKQGKHASG